MCLQASAGPLAGVKIIDFSRILAGPYCTQLLSDLGATVFKIERQNYGDDTRQWRPPAVAPESDLSCYFACVNRNKMSVAVDLKKERGVRLVRSLADKCDVLVENFLPGTMRRLNLSYDQLSKRNRKLVYASVSGYGQDGPWASRGGYDVIASAVGGLMHITGERVKQRDGGAKGTPMQRVMTAGWSLALFGAGAIIYALELNGPPCKAGVAVTDLLTGALAHGAILAALSHAQKTGRGQKVDCNLLATQVSMLANIGSNWINAKVPAKRWGTAHESIVPYQGFQAKDEKWFIVGGGNDSLFAQICKIINMPELCTDERFLTNAKRVHNREILLEILSKRFKEKTLAEWDPLFAESTVPFGPINDMEAVFDHPQVKHLDLVKTLHHPVTGPVKVVGPAVKYSVSQNAARTAPPILGEHTRFVLQKELGLSEGEVEKLKSDGVVDYP